MSETIAQVADLAGKIDAPETVTAQTVVPFAAELPPGWLAIESLDLEAQGVAHHADGKVIFVEGALPFEWVSANVYRKKPHWEQATLTTIHRESSQRVTPRCPHFGLHGGACGGCKMQHLHVGAQIAVKQRVLEDNLAHLGKVAAQTILPPIAGPAWGYRYRARLSVRYVIKKGAVLVGFHERKSRYVADMQQCPVLPPHVDAMLLPLRALIGALDARESCPQIELACGDNVTALVLRHMVPLSAGDIQKLREFAAHHSDATSAKPSVVQWWLQSKGPETVCLLDPVTSASQNLSYSLPDFGIVMPFKPTDFTQVNPYINRVLVARALALLNVQKHERVIDWFCGLGNFTLALATQAREVLGIEGSDTLVQRAKDNYHANQSQRASLAPLAPTDFVARNLFDMTPELLVQDAQADKWLVDPPREGAFALVQALAVLHQQQTGLHSQDNGESAATLAHAAWQLPKRIVYVSCNPATLARDADVLVNQAGYQCTHAGIVNMFPHTAHVESMAVFERQI